MGLALIAREVFERAIKRSLSPAYWFIENFAFLTWFPCLVLPLQFAGLRGCGDLHRWWRAVVTFYRDLTKSFEYVDPGLLLQKLRSFGLCEVVMGRIETRISCLVSRAHGGCELSRGHPMAYAHYNFSRLWTTRQLFSSRKMSQWKFAVKRTWTVKELLKARGTGQSIMQCTAKFFLGGKRPCTYLPLLAPQSLCQNLSVKRLIAEGRDRYQKFKV